MDVTHSSGTAMSLSGFTLIEMIVVILLIGILSGVLFTVLRGPMQAFVDVEKRTRLVDIADTALQRMAREIRLALPNSIRVTGGNTVDFLRTLDGVRYRAKPGGTGPAVCGGNTDGYAVVLTCSSVSFTEAGVGTYNVYALTSRATKGSPGDIAYVSRQINLSVTDAPYL